MRYRIVKSSMVVLAAAAAIAGTALAQDRDAQHQADRPAASQRSDQNSEQRGQRDSSIEQRGEHRETSRNDSARDHEDSHRMASADDRETNDRYRHEHPHAAARCHDGFFTRTSDRNLACSKHGGIDAWLLQ
jgi:hypothetical protein